jgi:hypothetical protein
MKLIRSCIVVAAATAVSLVPTAANADTKSHIDPSGDVRSVAYDASTDHVTNSPSTAEPGARLGDITKVKVAHSASTIKFTVRYRDLSKAGFVQVHEFVIAYPSGVRYVDVVAGPGHWKGKAIMTKRQNGKKISCNVSRDIDYGDNTVVVKVGVATLVGYGSKIYYDDAYSTGGEFTDNFVLSPKIHR